MINALIMAFATYTKIPMPVLSNDSANRGVRNMLCAFPATGLVTGMCQAALVYLMLECRLNLLFAAAIMTVCPVFINGGIHMDGFMDVSDAVSSWADREKKIQILKDPHIGSFAVIYACIYFVLYFGACSSIYEKAGYYFGWQNILLIVMIYPFERCLSALTSLWFKKMKKDGMLASSAGTEKVSFNNKRSLVLIVQLLLYGAALCMCGAAGIVIAVFMLLVTVYYRYFTMNVFGGVSGDTAGWLLQICELTAIVLAALT